VKEIAKITDSVKSVSGRALRYVEDKKIVTDMPKSEKGDFVVMKKIGDKRFKITVFEDGSPVKAKTETFPTVKGMTSFGVKVKALEKIAQAEDVSEPVAETATLEAPAAEAVVAGSADVRQTPAPEVESAPAAVSKAAHLDAYVKDVAENMAFRTA
jgi:hypothetical protein